MSFHFLIVTIRKPETVTIWSLMTDHVTVRDWAEGLNDQDLH